MTLILRNIVIGLILVFALGTGLVSFIGDFAAEYGGSLDANTSDVFGEFDESVLNETYQWTKGFQNATQTEEGVKESGGEIVMTANSYKILKQVYNLLPHTWNLITRFAKSLEIPLWAYTTALTIIMLIVVFSIISPISRKDT